MANRRMLAKTILQEDKFLEMPFSSQALYVQLNLEADDDGFVSGKRKMLNVSGADISDFSILVDNGYIIEFNSGVILITHWKIHNYIQADRYKETVFQAEKSTVMLNENNVYTLCIQDVYNMYPQDNIELKEDKLEIIKDNSTKENTEKRLYGIHQNIPLSESKYEQYKAQYSNIDEIIENYSAMVFNNPNTYKANNFNCFLMSQKKNSTTEAAPPK